MAKVVIFGLEDTAELAHYYLTHDSAHEVVAFTVDADYLPSDRLFCGLPVVAFSEITQRFPTTDYQLFSPMFGRKMSLDRTATYQRIKEKGYRCISYVSSKATVCDNEIGENCFILEDNTLQPFTKIGNNVVLWSGNHIGHHGEIHDHVFFTSHVVMSGHCVIESYAFLAVNASLRNGIRIAEGSFIGMSACVTADTEAWQVYTGVPAKKTGSSSRDIQF